VPKFGLFGGSFDPPHIGHLRLAVAAANDLGLERVFIVPSGQSPGKHTSFADDYDRLLMCQMTFGGVDDRFCVDDREIRRGGVSYTIDTLQELQEEYASNMDASKSWYIIAGADCLEHFHSWHEYRKILKLATLAIARREQGGAPFKHAGLSPTERGRVRFIDVEPTVVSSTEVRSAILGGGAWTPLVTTAVAEFIQTQELYAG
jgi:nicotinate-nucleotide adenylyltransferase